MEGHVSRWAVLAGTTKTCDTNPVVDAKSRVHWDSSLKLLIVFFVFVFVFVLLSFIFISLVILQTTGQGMKSVSLTFPECKLKPKNALNLTYDVIIM